MSVVTAARQRLGKGTYLSVGIEIPPRHGASFSMRYTSVKSLTEGWQLVRARMSSKRRRVNDIGELVMFSPDGRHKVVVGGYIKRPKGKLEKYLGSGAKIMSGMRHRSPGRAVRTEMAPVISRGKGHVAATWDAVHGDQHPPKGDISGGTIERDHAGQER